MVAGWVCRRCGNHFRFGLSMCPLCCSTSVDREDQEMAHATVHEQPVYDEDGEVVYAPPAPDPVPVNEQTDEVESDEVDADGDGLDDTTKQPIKKTAAKATRR